MKEIEEILRSQQQELRQLPVPEQLESRLRLALKNVPEKRTSKWKKKITIAACLVLLLGYNMNTLAFYAKRLVGYDQMMNGTLKQLNDLGKGQIIEKSFTFENGGVVTLDGMLMDSNQLLMFYTVKLPDTIEDWSDLNLDMSLEGFLGSYEMRNGQGELQEESREIKWMTSFEPPYFFAKSLTLKLNWSDPDNYEEGEISFEIDRNKAMGTTLKQGLNSKVKSGDTQLTFESIAASPTQTVVSGQIQNTLQLARDVIQADRIRPLAVDFNLIANGQELLRMGGSMSTDINGSTFHGEFDALPENLESLQIEVKSFSVDRDVNQQLVLFGADGIEGESQLINGQEIQINAIEHVGDNTFVTFTTEEHVRFTSVYLVAEGEKTGILETISGDGEEYEKKEDGTIFYTRTMVFPGIIEKPKLLIERMTYTEAYDQVIPVPLY